MSNSNRVVKRGGRNATRPRPLPPDVTARNLAYEKQRRQTFNDDLVNLARLVPALAQARRLSKVLIVNESIRHLRQRRGVCIAAARDMQELLAENSRLAAELNALRSQMGGSTMAQVETKPVTEAMLQLMDIENEAAGEFPEGFGESWAGRSSPSSKGNGAQTGGEEVRSSPDSFFPAQGRHHQARPPMSDWNTSFGNCESIIPVSQGQSRNAGNTGSASDEYIQPSLPSCPEVFAPIEAVPTGYAPTESLEYLAEPVDETSIDFLSVPWMNDIGLVRQGSANTANGKQGENENFEDLWDFWIGQV